MGHPGPSETRPPSSASVVAWEWLLITAEKLSCLCLTMSYCIMVAGFDETSGELVWQRTAMLQATMAWDFSPDSMVKVCVHIVPEPCCGVCRILACPPQCSVATRQSWAMAGSSVGISQPSLAQVHAASGECLSANSTGQIEVA